MERPLYLGPAGTPAPGRILLILAVALSAPRLPAQTSPALQTRQPPETRLTLDAILPRPLTPAGLRLRLDGKPIPSTELTIAPEQPQLLFVLDALNTPLADLVRCQQALLDWLAAAPGLLPYDTSILLVADTTPRFRNLPAGTVPTWELIRNELYTARLSPTRNPAELAAKLAAYNPGLPRLETATQIAGNERVTLSLQALSFFANAMKAAPAAKLILWLSPGWPYVHLEQSGYTAQVFDSILYFDDALRAARIVLYAVDPTGAATDHLGPVGGPVRGSQPASNFYRSFLDPVRSAEHAEPNDMALPVLATHSGGTVQIESNDLLGGITRFAADAANVVSLTLPAPKPTGRDTFHTLQLDIPAAGSAPADVARIRSGFYAR